MTPAELKAEIETDPAGIGYATYRWDSSAGLASLLNAPQGLAADVWCSRVPSDVLRARVTRADFVALSTGDRSFLAHVLGGEYVDLSVTALRSDLAALFGGQSETRAAWLTAAQRKPSRAEHLWGIDTVITIPMVDAARIHTP